MFIKIWFQDCRHLFIILGLFTINKEVANHVSKLLIKIVIFIPCTLRNRFRNAALTSRNIPGMRYITGQTVRNRLCGINPVPLGSKTCPKTSSPASGIVMSKAAHLAASTKMENRELERQLRRRRNAAVNHQQLVQALWTNGLQSPCLYSAFD